MKPRIYVFYASLLHSEWSEFPTIDDLGSEVYNGGWVWVADNWLPHSIYRPIGWYRPDQTPYPKDQVPIELRAMALLMR